MNPDPNIGKHLSPSISVASLEVRTKAPQPETKVYGAIREEGERLRRVFSILDERR